MKTQISILLIILNFISCKSNNTIQQHITKNQFTTQRDTLIDLKQNLSLYFGSYHEETKLWYNPYIVKNQKKIKLSIGTDYSGYGSELNYSLSPNSRYLVLDGIIKEYVYENEKDSVLHENYTCSIIDIEKVKSVKQMQEDCGGKWNDKNQWVVGEKVIFE